MLWGLVLSVVSCLGAPPAAAESSEEAAILAVIDSYMRAISADDLKRMAELQMAEGMTFVDRVVDGRRRIVARSNAYWVEPARKSDVPVRERYWNPTLLIRGSIALVWTPYEFWSDGKVAHCGIDTFDMVKVEGQWRVANSMWTVEPDACAELSPKDPSQIRPRD